MTQRLRFYHNHRKHQTLSSFASDYLSKNIILWYEQKKFTATKTQTSHKQKFLQTNLTMKSIIVYQSSLLIGVGSLKKFFRSDVEIF